jgi:glycerol-3-phosphate acyltransferase PlsY
MDPLIAVAVAVGVYLIGSISFARIITAIFSKNGRVPEETPLSLEGSDKTLVMKTVSATSVSRNVGPRYGFMTYVLDVLKVFIPVILLRQYMPGTRYYLIAATTGVVGHIWPVYHRFKGGRGISAIYGGVFAIDWLGVLVAAFGGMILGFVVLKDLYITYMAGLWMLIPWLWWRTRDPYVIAYVIVVNIFFTVSTLGEAREWFRIKKEPVWDDHTEAWKVSAMGRGIIKAGLRLGLMKKKQDRKK